MTQDHTGSWHKIKARFLNKTDLEVVHYLFKYPAGYYYSLFTEIYNYYTPLKPHYDNWYNCTLFYKGFREQTKQL
jgi:hypothetical protein